METTKTGWEWCVQERVRLLHLSQWPTIWTFHEESYFEERITYTDFLERIRCCEVKPNSQPRKTEDYLEYKMYGFVMYNLSDKQKGIQFGHAKDEYGLKFGESPAYKKWSQFDKTYIILDGGTSNRHGYSEYDKPHVPKTNFGSMERNLSELTNNGVLAIPFYEPDLNNATSGIAFLVDERVFNREIYPDFVRSEFISDEQNDKQYKNWVEKIGGEKNVFLRQFLPKFKLA